MGPQYLKNGAAQCFNQVSEFFKSYELNLKIQSVGETDAHHRVTLVDRTGRSNSTTWYEDDVLGQCPVIAHEISHLLGLPDEYQEDGSDCLVEEYAAKEENPYSLMAVSASRYGNVELMPRHLLAILEQALPTQLELNIQSDLSLEAAFPQCEFSNSIDLKSGDRIELFEMESSEFQ